MSQELMSQGLIPKRLRSQDLITEFIEQMHNQNDADTTENEYKNDRYDSYITLLGYPQFNFEKDLEEIIKMNDCKCCKDHKNNKYGLDKFNKTVYECLETTNNKNEKDCECDCRNKTLDIAHNYNDVYDILSDYIECNLKKEEVMKYDEWVKTCVEFNPKYKSLYCSKKAVDSFNNEGYLFMKYLKEVEYKYSFDGSIMSYCYYTSYLVRYEMDGVEYIYSIILCEEEINLDYWHECKVYRVPVRDDEPETKVISLIRLN